MNITFSEQDRSFQQEVRDWLSKAWPLEMREKQARSALDYYSHTRDGSALIGKLAALQPGILACMHGASWRGDGAALLEALGRRLDA